MHKMDLVKRSEFLTKELSANESEKIASAPQMNEFKRKKLQNESQKNWERFYKRNSSNFFKDRNWTKRDLQLLCDEINLNDSLIFVEAGCGCGNTIFPLVNHFPNWHFYGVDFSANALSLLQKRAAELKINVISKHADLSCENLELELPAADLISAIFVLSAIPKNRQINFIQNLYKILKPGGSVIFRDYGAYDHAMMRFSPSSKIDERFYARQDGTMAYYFFIDELRNAFESCGFTTSKCHYVYRETRNIKEEICLERIFVEGRFIKKIIFGNTHFI